MFLFFRKIAENETLQTVILFVIIINAFFLGLETYPAINNQFSYIIDPVIFWSQYLFLIEIIIRVLAYGPNNYRGFFKDFWNRFDFIIVAVSFFPFIGGFFTIARVIRVLRILRILSISDELRENLSKIKTTFSGVFLGFIIYLVLTYTISIIGFHIFGGLDYNHWGNLHNSFISVVFLSLFQELGSIFGTILKIYPISIIFIIIFYLIEITIIFKLLKNNKK